MGRVICVTDVHGCYDEFMLLLEKAKYSEGVDRLVLAGDLVDRGPASAKVVQWTRLAMAKHPGLVECVMGNHDDKHFRYWKHVLKKREHSNYKIPMRPFSTDKLQVFNSLQDEDLEFIGQLPAFISLQEDREGWLVVHAGLEPGKELKDQDMGKMTHIRFLHQETRKTVSLDDNHQPPAGSVYWTEMYDLPYSVVYGHTVHSFTKPEVTKKAHGPTLVGLDTGACFGGRLSAFFIPEHGEKVGPEHFVQVQASKAYSRSLLQNVKWDE